MFNKSIDEYKNKNASFFQISNVDLSIVNAIRRTILSDIENVAFYFDNDNKDPEKSYIKIIENNSPLHNEFISQRISMIPIFLSTSEIHDWNNDFTFEIDVTNNTNNILAVTSKDIKIYSNESYVDDNIRDKMFPPFIIDKNSYYIPITKLPPGGQLKVQMNAIKGTASKNACFGVVSLCTFENMTDEQKKISQLNKFIEKTIDDDVEDLTEKKKTELTRQFNTLDIQRAFKTNQYNEPSEFTFKLESTCLLSNYEIFSLGLDKLIDNVQNIFNNFKELVTIEKVDEVFNITILEQTHTIGNLFQCLIYNKHIRSENDTKIDFIGYFVPHPLDKRIIIKMKYNNENNDIEKVFKDIMIQNVIDELNLVQKEWIEFTKKNN